MTDIRYQKGKIYKIVCNKTGLLYVGSTIQNTLAQRLADHRFHYKEWLLGKRTFITSFKIIENDDYNIILLESVNCSSNDELLQRERYWIQSTICVNKHIPSRTPEEYRDKHKDHKQEYDEEYRLNNNDKKRETNKAYRLNNKQ